MYKKYIYDFVCFRFLFIILSIKHVARQVERKIRSGSQGFIFCSLPHFCPFQCMCASGTVDLGLRDYSVLFALYNVDKVLYYGFSVKLLENGLFTFAYSRCRQNIHIVVMLSTTKIFRIGQKNSRTNKYNNGFDRENKRKYDTIQPMKCSVQQEVRPYPTFYIQPPLVTLACLF